MEDLTAKHCVACAGNASPLAVNSARALLKQIDDWTLRDDGKEISRLFCFKNYYETLAFVNALAWIAHGEDHHPDLEVGYNRCLVRYSTHTIKGLSENDFICAAKINKLCALSDQTAACPAPQTK